MTTPRAAFWTLITIVTALTARWFGLVTDAYPRLRESGPSAACEPAAARDEQRLADTLPWRLTERALATRALQPFREKPSFERLNILNLDFGPGGVAAALRQIAPLDSTIVATDPVGGMGPLARHRLARRAARPVHFLQSWSSGLPFRNATFDLVVATGAMHGWPNPEAALVELRRVLKPKGRYYVADLRRNVSPLVWIGFRLVQALATPKDLRALGEPASSLRAAYSPQEAEWLAARAKLPDIQITTGPAWIVIQRSTGTSAARAASPA